MTGNESFSLFPEVKLKSFFFHLLCMVVFAVMFLVVVIDSHP